MPPLENVIAGAIAVVAIVILALLWDMADAQGAPAPAPASRADQAAAQVCQGQPFEWQGKTLVCHKEHP